MTDNELIKIENSSFARDKVSKSVINTNSKDQQLYLARKNAIKAKDKRIELLENRISNLEKKCQEILNKLNT